MTVFEPLVLVIEAFADRLGRNYRAVFGKGEPDHAPIIRATARLALERIAGTDAVYHDVLHTLFVADVGQSILRGRAMAKAVGPSDWLHFTAATLLHDIGYLRASAPATAPAATSSTPPAIPSRHPVVRPTHAWHPGTSSAARSSSATAAPPSPPSMWSVSAGRSS